jgi:hypothetical protein
MLTPKKEYNGINMEDKSSTLVFRQRNSSEKTDTYNVATPAQISHMMRLKRKHLHDIANIAAREKMTTERWSARLDRNLYGEQYRRQVSFSSLDQEDPREDPDIPFAPLGIRGTEDYYEQWREHFLIGFAVARRRGFPFREIDQLDILGEDVTHKAIIAKEMGLVMLDGEWRMPDH